MTVNKMNIKIKAWFGDWQDAIREQARRFWLTWSRGAQGLKEEEKAAVFEQKHLRGATVAELMEG